jgi:homoserine O-succinyltransferase
MKHELPAKLSGIYRQKCIRRSVPLVRGFDDEFMAPQSRYTTVSKSDIQKDGRLEILAESEETGPYLILGDGGKRVFVTGHPEYDAATLDREYHRDITRGLDPKVPVHYYPDDDPSRTPMRSWRCHAMMLYTNWLNYYVYQVTPYVL